MKIVNVIGGLGNQMFQCALAIALRETYKGEDVLIDTHHYKNPFPKTFMGNNYYHNGFEITKVFNKYPITEASQKQIKKVSRYIPNYFLSRISRKFLPKKKNEYVQKYIYAYLYDHNVFSDKAIEYFEGYWLSPKYFDFCKHKVIEAFEFLPFTTEQNIEYAKILRKDNSITIHIRRGDYVNARSFKDICTLEYYRKAISAAKLQIDNPLFFIFSNDEEWCLKNLNDEFGVAKVYFVNNNKGSESYRDMQLMSLARCNILANSSFSWWGAYLNSRKDNIVYVPSRWVNKLDDKDAYSDKWIKI